jgi:hypothetical protein
MPLSRRAAHAVIILAGMVTARGSLRAQAQAPAEPKWYERLQFEGDIRPRYDLTYQDQGPGKENEDLRTRVRFRLRLGVTSPVGKHFQAGFRLTSNEGKNPTSGNVTLGHAEEPKTIVLDRAWASWTPGAALTMTAGKFGNPIEKPGAVFRSELVWDEDLSPEGLSETVTLLRSSKGVVRRLAVNLEQWYLLEFAKADDSWMLGGQAVLGLHPGARADLTLTGAYYNYANGPALAQAANSNDQILVSNSVVLEDGTVLEGGKLLKPDPANPFDHFRNEFRLVYGSAALHLDNALGQAGLQLYGEVVRNTAADEEGLGYQAGIGLDRLRPLPGWSLAAAWTHVERESVLSMFSYSDIGRGGTNQQGVVLLAQYRPVRNVTLSARHHIVSPIRPVQPDTPTQRLQVDVTLAF